MEPFFIIVLVIAAITLIIFLTVFGLLIQKQTTSEVYPPSSLQCPDYWSYTTDASGSAICTPHISMNKGTDIDEDNTPGLADNGSINFADSTWASQFMSTSKCAHHNWAKLHNVNWDGVSNYNSC